MRGQQESDRDREKRTTTINMTCRNFPNGSLHIQAQSEGAMGEEERRKWREGGGGYVPVGKLTITGKNKNVKRKFFT
jgi:hypothetical protein